MTLRLGLVLLVCFAAACDHPISSSSIEEAVQLLPSDGDVWFVLRRDARKCAAPRCGGWFVKQVNRATTTCLDGSEAPECYVEGLDWSSTRFSADEQVKLSATPAVFRGAFVAAEDVGRFAALRVGDVWAPAVTPSVVGGYLEPAATFYRASDNGARCITWPCPTTTQQKLNGAESLVVAGVDLSASCADARQTDEGYRALVSAAGILVDGSDDWIRGPGGTMRELVALDFYLRVEPAVRHCGAVGGDACRADEYCDVSVGACGTAAVDGMCKHVDEMCMDRYKPVCGCDGKTYANDCIRLRARVAVDHGGACAQ
jgi:hypothetical protein